LGIIGSVPRRLAVALAVTLGCTLVAAFVPSAGSATAARSSVRAARSRWAVAEVGTQERGTSNCSAQIDGWSATWA